MARRKRSFTPIDRARYAFDRAVSASTFTHIGLLGVLALSLITFATAVVIQLKLHQTGQPPYTEREAFWWTIQHALDTGALQNDQGWPIRLTMMAVTLGGMMVVSLLIGVMTAGIDRKLTELRKGRSHVVEADHTLILGWSPAIFTLVQEIVQANAHRARGRIVILADQDKVEMEDELRARIGKTGRTQVICRSGDPIDPSDLDIVNPADAKAIVVLAPETRDPDAHVIKTVLALTRDAATRATPYHIVAELQDAANLEVARLVGRQDAQLVVASELIARIAVQTCLCSGTAAVYVELLDFCNSEFYGFDAGPVVGTTFGEAVLRFEETCPVGLRRPGGTLLLAPPAGTPIEAGDRLIMVAQTDDPVKPGPPLALDLPSLPVAAIAPPQPVRTLLLGWNREALAIVRELDAAVIPGSELVIVAEQVPQDLGTVHQRISVKHGDTASRAVLAALEPAGFDHVIVLGLTEALDAQEADARTLVTLLHLRTILDALGTDGPTLVAEMVDPRNRDLARAARVDDFIASEKLVSLMLAQLAENPEVEAVFAELLRPGGCVIRIRPAAEYPGADFRAVSAAALARAEVAIGLRHQGVLTINPAKSTPKPVGPDAQIVVLAHTPG